MNFFIENFFKNILENFFVPPQGNFISSVYGSF